MAAVETRTREQRADVLAEAARPNEGFYVRVSVPAWARTDMLSTARKAPPMNDLAATILALAGIALAGTLAVLDQAPLLTDAVIGAGAGVIVAKLLVRRLERRGGELPARRVRQLEATWTALGILLAIALYAVVEGLL